MRAWNYTDIYIAACLRPFNTHAEGRRHERDCPECQAIIRGEPESEPEEIVRIVAHPQGGWMAVVRNADGYVEFVANDGGGLGREEAEALLRKLNAFIASRN